MSKCKTVQDENKIETIVVKTKDAQVEVPKQSIAKQPIPKAAK
jgi:hypothetical protein